MSVKLQFISEFWPNKIIINFFRVFSAIIFSAMIVGEAMSYLGDYTKATVSAAKIFKLIYESPAIDAYSDGGDKEVGPTVYVIAQ